MIEPEEAAVDGKGRVKPGGAAAAGKKLTERQWAVVAALVSGMKQCEAAQAAGVPERTLRDWLRTPPFRQALQQARADLWTDTASFLQTQCREAVQTLRAVMQDEKARGFERVAAARALLEQSRKALEVDDVQLRLAEVEAKLEEVLGGLMRTSDCGLRIADWETTRGWGFAEAQSPPAPMQEAAPRADAEGAPKRFVGTLVDPGPSRQLPASPIRTSCDGWALRGARNNGVAPSGLCVTAALCPR